MCVYLYREVFTAMTTMPGTTAEDRLINGPKNRVAIEAMSNFDGVQLLNLKRELIFIKLFQKQIVVNERVSQILRHLNLNILLHIHDVILTFPNNQKGGIILLMILFTQNQVVQKRSCYTLTINISQTIISQVFSTPQAFSSVIGLINNKISYRKTIFFRSLQNKHSSDQIQK